MYDGGVFADIIRSGSRLDELTDILGSANGLQLSLIAQQVDDDQGIKMIPVIELDQGPVDDLMSFFKEIFFSDQIEAFGQG